MTRQYIPAPMLSVSEVRSVVGDCTQSGCASAPLVASCALFAGCTGTVCGVALSQPLQDFLNFPNLNLLFCGLLADCSNVAFTSGTVGEVSEQLTITLDAPTASSDALIAAGDATVCHTLRLHSLFVSSSFRVN